jgi:hypothetical protein
MAEPRWRETGSAGSEMACSCALPFGSEMACGRHRRLKLQEYPEIPRRPALAKGGSGPSKPGNEGSPDGSSKNAGSDDAGKPKIADTGGECGFTPSLGCLLAAGALALVLS